jgi:flagellar basal-body rod protein FlgG
MRALAIAATGMSAQQQNIEIISNNIANINTTAFKKSRGEFTDLLYQTERLQGISNQGSSATVPQGAQLGLGVRLAAIRSLQVQGALTQTGNSYDLAMNGRGWFQLLGPNNETVYSRSGSFSPNANGQLVNVDGWQLQPTITVPNNATSVTVSQSGVVSAQIPGQTAPQQLGQLTVATFPNDAGLDSLGGNLFRQTEASGTPVTGVPGDPGFGTVQQGYLEASNVDPVKELVGLISAQRAFELNSKVIQAVDDMAGTVSKGIR